MSLNTMPAKPAPSPSSGETIANLEGFRWLLLLFWSGFLLLISYRTALSLPFMADDFFHFPFVDEHTFSEIWQTAEGLYYFRPVAFAYWKIAAAILGGHNPLVLHASNLIVHWINALLVAWLADRLWAAGVAANWTRRFLAAALFIVFPLGYEAVPWVGSFMHPVVTTLVLVSVIGYLQMRDHGRLVWGIVSLLCAFLAPFTHENGIVALPLIAAVESTRIDSGGRSLGRRIGLVALWIIPLILWYVIWRQEPQTIGTGGLGLNSISTMLRNSVYVLQALAYPLTLFAVPLLQGLPVAELPATAVLSILMLGAAALVQWRGGADRRSILPWLWVLLATTPAIAFLTFSYLQAAPRILMLAGAGIVWLWVDVIVLLQAALRQKGVTRWLTTLIPAFLFSLILMQSIIYIREQMRTYEAGGALIWDIVHKTAETNDMGQLAIFANMPTWLALPRSHFAVGEEGAMLMPSVGNIDTLVSVHTGRPAQIAAIEHAPTRQEMPYYHGVIGAELDWARAAETGAQVFTTRYVPDFLFAQPAGAITSSEPDQGQDVLAQFGECLILQAVVPAYVERQLTLELEWQNSCPIPPEATVFVHLLAGDGRLIGQGDGDPLAGILPFSAWPDDVIVHDIRPVTVEEQPRRILVGLYDRYSGERVPAYDGSGQPLADQAAVVDIP